MTSNPSATSPSGSAPLSSYPWAQSSSSWPSSPGVYWFLDAAGNVLYVGKATNLKSRISFYTRVNPSSAKTHALVKTASQVNFKSLDSPFQAQLIESELIKLHQPKYNILLKDDKSPIYIVITKEPYPRVLTARKKQLHTIYHHLPPSNIFGPYSSAQAAKIILRTSRKIFKFCTAKPSQRGKPCFYTHINQCSGACYQAITPKQYRQSINHLKAFLRGKHQRLQKKLTHSMTQAATQKNFEQAQIFRDQLSLIQQALSKPDHNLDEPLPILQQDQQAAALAQASHLLHQHGLLPAQYPLTRIEAYDISNTQGTFSTASMVAFIQAQPDPSQYRRFRIRYTSVRSDPAMLQEALSRRLNHPEWPFPNLILIDGGKGQLKAALKITQGKIPTISLVKRPDRILIPFKKDLVTVKLQPDHPAHAIFIQLRDESHRFAKAYHSHLRRQGMIKS